MLIKELIILVNQKILSIMTALVLGVGTIVSSLSLIGFAAYLISMAALRPGFEQLYLAIVAVRFLELLKRFFVMVKDMSPIKLLLKFLPL